MKILISGGTGFIGTALCEYLIKNNDLVVKTRNPKSTHQEIKYIATLSEIDPDEVIDIVINLAGESIANKRWSNTQKQKIVESRLSITEEFIAFFKRIEKKPRLFISGSAIGYYGIEAGDSKISEEDSGDDSFSSNLCTKWESSALQAESLGIRTCILRTGIVLGKEGGVLKKMLPAFKFGLGGNIGMGKQWMSWIHMADIIGIINHCIIDEDLKGPMNCTAPHPVTNIEFTETLGRLLSRPTVVNIPEIMIKILMGEMGKELLLSGKRIVPNKAMNSGYEFKYNSLETALTNILT